MTLSPPEMDLSTSIQQAYLAAIDQHGDLGLELEYYFDRLVCVCRKYLGEEAASDISLRFTNALHTNDLYLTVACARPLDSDWERFAFLYETFINKVASRVCETADANREIAGSIQGYIFLPDASGRSRIASYEGKSSLAAWLGAVINNRALKERRSYKALERLDEVTDIRDFLSVERTELVFRASSYVCEISEALSTAGKCLDERERLVLSLKYLDGLDGTEIAQIIGVHPSTVSRHLGQIYQKLQDKTIAALADALHLPHETIIECMTDVCENPDYSILIALRESIEEPRSRCSETLRVPPDPIPAFGGG